MSEDAQIDIDFGPGGRLLQARRAKGLNKKAVASQLKLTPQKIGEIESDHYRSETPLTFYRGYVRAYAKLVDIPEDEIMANFDEFVRKSGLTEPEPKFERPKNLGKTGGSDLGTKLVATATVLILIALAVWIYLSMFAGSVSNGTQEGAPNNSLPVPSTTESDGAVGSPSATQAGTESSPTGGELAINLSEREQVLIDAADLITETDVDAQNNAETIGSGSGSAAEPASGTVNQTSTERLPQADPQSTVNAAGTASDRLVLTFSEACWVRVTDATGRVLVLGTKPAGRRISVTGTAPLQVILGNVPGVSLEYDGSAVDLSNYSPTRPARLSLGEER